MTHFFSVRIQRLALSLLAFSVPGSLWASAYCSIVEKQKDCQYASWKECKQAIGDRGMCVINAAEGQTSPTPIPAYAIEDQRLKQQIQDGKAAVQGSAAYCVQTLNSLRCHYPDYASCQTAAAGQGGTCRLKP
ncbi:MAG: hypothetical protein RBS36_00960 [Thiomicrospira sp.]|jgi:hypothetical protein|nr:hypothetical protein [Thiomicrospira sp.]